MSWRLTDDGYPIWVDGSLADWLRSQDARRRARGLDAGENKRQAQQAIAALAAAGGAAASTVVLAPVGALAVFAAGMLAVSTSGGLTASNDMDRDGLPDHLHAPTADLEVQRALTRTMRAGPLYPGKLLTMASVVVTELGTDMFLYWVGVVLQPRADRPMTAQGEVAHLPRAWAETLSPAGPAPASSGALVRPS